MNFILALVIFTSAFIDASAQPVCQVCTPCPIPAAPANLKAVSPNSSSIQLTWTEATPNLGSYVLQRKTTMGVDPWVTIPGPAATASSFLDIGLTQNWQYDYQLRAADGAGTSAFTQVLGTRVQMASSSSISSASSTSSSLSSSASSASSQSGSSASSASSSSSSNSSIVNPVTCNLTIQPIAGDNTGNVQTALDKNKGLTICLAPGTFNFNNSLAMHSGNTLAADGTGRSHLNFNLPAPSGSTNGYAFNLDANSSNITIENLDIHSNHGIVGMLNGSHFSNITFTFNRFQYGGGSEQNGVYITGIYLSTSCDQLKITHNYFHDSQVNRNWELWGVSNGNMDYNTSYNVSDAGHFMNQGNNNSISFNYSTHLHRMAQEIQGTNSNVGNIVQGNVAYDWILPYNDSFGLSVVPAGSQNEVVKNNYIRFSIAPGSGWGTQSCASGSGSICGPNRFGYGIEESGVNMQVTGNTIIMPATAAAGVDICTGAIPTGNKMYGGALWSVMAEECGAIAGWSNVNSMNTLVSSTANAPQPPPNTNAYLPSAN